MDKNMKILDFFRRFLGKIGIIGDGVHTFCSLIVSVVFFYAGVWFEASHSVWAGFFAAIICTTVLGIAVELAQGIFEKGTASIRDVICDLAGASIGALLLLVLSIIF